MATSNLLLRNDTVLGVCEGLGRDLGFNPLWLRLAFIGPLFFFPLATIGVYLGLGLIVALASFAAPDRAVPTATVERLDQPVQAEAASDDDLRLAA